MSSVIDSIERGQLKQGLPKFDPGDRVRVHFQVIEGSRRRTQVFEGVVLRRQGSGARETFTVRKQSFGVGVERTFPLHSPKIEKLEVAARGAVRRAKLYYLRGRTGKAARVAERRWGIDEDLVSTASPAAGSEAVDAEGATQAQAVDAPEAVESDEATEDTKADTSAEEMTAAEPAESGEATEDAESTEPAEPPASEDSSEEGDASEGTPSEAEETPKAEDEPSAEAEESSEAESEAPETEESPDAEDEAVEEKDAEDETPGAEAGDPEGSA